MKTIVLFFMFFYITNIIYSQELNINKIEISNIYKNVNNKSFELSEDDEKGPYILLKLQITNNSNKNICLSPSKSRIKIIFTYNEKIYENINYEHVLQEIDSVNLKPNESFYYIIYDYLLGGTSLLKEKNFNYIVEALKILPTLKVQYKELKRDLEIFSDRIDNVILIDKDLMLLNERNGSK